LIDLHILPVFVSRVYLLFLISFHHVPWKLSIFISHCYTIKKAVTGPSAIQRSRQ